MLLRHFVISLILFGMVIGASSILMSELQTGYNVSISDPAFNATFDKIGAITNDTSTMYNRLNSSEGIETSGGELFYKNTWSTIKLVFKSVDLVPAMITTSFQSFGADSRFDWFPAAIMAIIFVTITFIILSSLLRRAI